MQVQTSSISDVLTRNSTSFFIPPYQRAYSWTRKEIERYFKDLTRIVDSDLDPQEKDKLEHFFGTLVFKNEPDGFANRYVVIDGQQRLTSTLLLCIALRDLESDPKIQQQITDLYLLNTTSTYEEKIKLKQVTSDWEAYKALILGDKSIRGNITIAYEYFKKLITINRSSDQRRTTEAYINALTRLNVAVIFLDERPYKGEDPQIIFETLNSLGKPLSLADLIRNYILLGMRTDSQSDIYEKVWQPKIEQPLGEELFLSKFFRDYLQCKECKPFKVVSDGNTKELYYQFKDFVDQTFADKNKFITDIVSYVPCYLAIVKEKPDAPLSSDKNADGEIKELLRNIFHDIGGEAFKSLVLELLHMHQSSILKDARLIETLETIRTYLIRRRILGLTLAENRNIPMLTASLPKVSSGQTTLLQLLTNQFYALRMPNDNEVRDTLKQISFYKQVSRYSKFVLGKMEKRQAKVAINFRDPKVTIEHIMPQTLNDSWYHELGEEADAIWKKYLHNIGNLILTEFNSEMGNRSFEAKKQMLKGSTIKYHEEICSYQEWNEASILAHRDKMIDLFLRTFPLPDEYRTSDNWHVPDDSEVDSLFYPLDPFSPSLTGHKPEAIRLFGEWHVAHSWRAAMLLFFRQTLRQYPDACEKLLSDSLRLFGKSNAIIRWRDLRHQIENHPNPGFRRWFKTLDNEYSDNLNAIDDDCIFIYVNHSSRTIIDRIYKAMEFLELDRDDVLIRLA